MSVLSFSIYLCACISYACVWGCKFDKFHNINSSFSSFELKITRIEYNNILQTQTDTVFAYYIRFYFNAFFFLLYSCNSNCIECFSLNRLVKSGGACLIRASSFFSHIAQLCVAYACLCVHILFCLSFRYFVLKFGYFTNFPQITMCINLHFQCLFFAVNLCINHKIMVCCFVWLSFNYN